MKLTAWFVAWGMFLAGMVTMWFLLGGMYRYSLSDYRRVNTITQQVCRFTHKAIGKDTEGNIIWDGYWKCN